MTMKRKYSEEKILADMRRLSEDDMDILWKAGE